jgi:hypothetical protein
MAALKVLTIGVAELVRVRIFPKWRLVGTHFSIYVSSMSIAFDVSSTGEVNS